MKIRTMKIMRDIGIKLTNRDALKRYDRARKVMRDLASRIFKTIGTKASYLRCADHLGMREGNAIITENETEGDVFMDFFVFADLIRGRNAAERFLRQQQKSLTDEEIAYLKAMGNAHYSIFIIDDAVPGQGVTFTDALTGKKWFVVDRQLSVSAQPGLLLGSRLIDQGDFAMCSGAALPTDLAVLDGLYVMASRRLRQKLDSPIVELSASDQSVLQRLVIRDAMVEGVTETTYYAES